MTQDPEPCWSALQLLAEPKTGQQELLRLALQELLANGFYSLEAAEVLRDGKWEALALLRRGGSPRPQSPSLRLVVDLIEVRGEGPLPLIVARLLSRPKSLKVLADRMVKELVEGGLATTSRRPLGGKTIKPTSAGLSRVHQGSEEASKPDRGLDHPFAQGLSEAARGNGPVGSMGSSDSGLDAWLSSYNTGFAQGLASHQGGHDGGAGGWGDGHHGSGHSGGHDGGHGGY